VLLAPHHGSKTSSSEAFLTSITPRFAIASAGYLNAYHHPAPVVRARYRALDIPLFNTAETGAVTVAFPVGGVPYVAARERVRQARYWRESALSGAEATAR
jgi:competence protein ComEC